MPTTPAWSTLSRWVVLLLVVATITWRPQVFYTGGLDPIVAAKAMLVSVAIALAWFARVQRGAGRPMGTAHLWLLLGYLTAAAFGAWTLGILPVTAIMAIRILMLAVAVALLVKTFPAEQLFRDVIAVTLLVGTIAVVSGLGRFVATGRLGGGIPPLHPNELALLCAIPAIGCCHLVLQGRARLWQVAAVPLMLGAIWATGSRTSLMAVLAAILVMLLQSRRLHPAMVVALACSVPVAAYVVLATPLLADFFGRGGTDNLMTLNSRSIGWAGALAYPETVWNHLFGSGLAVRMVPVLGQYWDEQVIDSSWVSAFVHAGWVGAGALALWMTLVAWRSTRVAPERRMLAQGLLVFLLIRSVLESGLIDSTPAFLVLCLISLTLDRGSVLTDRAAQRSVDVPSGVEPEPRSPVTVHR